MEEQFEVIAEVRGEERQVWIDHTHSIKVNNDYDRPIFGVRTPLLAFSRVEAAILAAHVRSTLNVASVSVRSV